MRDFFARTFVSLRAYRDYRLFWAGSWSEHLGEWMETTALLWLLNDMTHSPLMGTLMVTLRALPMVVFAFVGGIIADRINRRILLMFSLGAAAIFSIILAVFVHLQMIQPWMLLLYSALTAIVTSFNHPARSTLLPNLVKREHFLNAITMDNVSVTGSRILGASLGGIIVNFAGTTPVLGVRAAGAILSLVWIYMLRAPETPAGAKKDSPWNNLMEGLQYVGKHKQVLTQVLLYLLPIFVSNSYIGLLPFYATDVLHIGPSLYGFLAAASGLGAILVTFVLANIKNIDRYGWTLLVCGMAQGALLIVFAFSAYYILAFLILMLLGAAGTFFMTVNNTIIQQLITDHVRGRVMSLREVSFGLGPAGSLISGAIAGSIGVPPALFITGVITLVIFVGVRLGVQHSKSANIPSG
jgi:MFS family permease